MNVWADKFDDIRFSLNDVYMIFLMTGWMFFFMGLVYKDFSILFFGIILVTVSYICIRTQLFVSTRQFLLGMIPHHSMAVLMSKKLLEKNPSAEIAKFANSIVMQQEKEIDLMKRIL